MLESGETPWNCIFSGMTRKILRTMDQTRLFYALSWMIRICFLKNIRKRKPLDQRANLKTPLGELVNLDFLNQMEQD